MLAVTVAGWIVLAQLSSGSLANVRRHREESRIVVDASVVAPQASGREPSEIANPRPAPVAPVLPVEPPRSPERAPVWVYVVIVAVLAQLALAAVFVWRKFAHRVHHLPLPEEDDAAAPSAAPKSAGAYLLYLNVEDEPKRLLSSGEKRTPDQCYALYIEGVRKFVQRKMWPEKMRTALIESDPPETRWRAWLGEWDKEHVMRATGKSEGMALKNLLRKYRQNGGEWIAHAVEQARSA